MPKITKANARLNAVASKMYELLVSLMKELRENSNDSFYYSEEERDIAFMREKAFDIQSFLFNNGIFPEEELLTCPCCGEANGKVFHENDVFFVGCTKCAVYAGKAKTREEAIRK